MSCGSHAERYIVDVKMLFELWEFFYREIIVTKRYYVSCGSFVERNILDLKMICELWEFVDRNIGDVKMLCELREFCGGKYW
jgi:hypothetical protein